MVKGIKKRATEAIKLHWSIGCGIRNKFTSPAAKAALFFNAARICTYRAHWSQQKEVKTTYFHGFAKEMTPLPSALESRVIACFLKFFFLSKLQMPEQQGSVVI